MTETAQKQRMTWDDYAALPDDGKVYQVLKGELIVSPSPIWAHQQIAGKLYAILLQFIEEKELGGIAIAPMDVILGPGDFVQPDIVFVGNDRKDIIADKIEGPPTLAVEVLSPGSTQTDTVDKFARYAEFGVPHYWIVNPDDRVAIVYRLPAEGKIYERIGLYQGDDSFTHELFEGLTIELAKLWPKR